MDFYLVQYSETRTKVIMRGKHQINNERTELVYVVNEVHERESGSQLLIHTKYITKTQVSQYTN